MEGETTVTVETTPPSETPAADQTQATTLALAAAAGAAVEASHQATQEAAIAQADATNAQATASAALSETETLRAEVTRLTAALEANNQELASLRAAAVAAALPAPEVTEIDVAPPTKAPENPPKPNSAKGWVGRLFLGT